MNGLELDTDDAEDSVKGEDSESEQDKDEHRPLPTELKKRRSQEEHQFVNPSKKAVHAYGQSDSDDDSMQGESESDSGYSPPYHSNSSDQMSLASSFRPHTRHISKHTGEAPGDGLGFPLHARLTMELPMLVTEEPLDTQVPEHVRVAKEASAQDLAFYEEEPLWPEKSEEEESLMSHEGEPEQQAGPRTFSVWSQRPFVERLVEEAEMRDFSLMDGKPAFEALFEPWYEHSCEPVEPHPDKEEVHGVLTLQSHDLCQNRRRELGVHQLTDQDYQDMAHVFMHKLYGQPYSHYWHVEANEVGWLVGNSPPAPASKGV